MQIKDKVNQTLGYVEQYYHQHKRDALKPKIWELIVTIRYLTHEVNAVKERNDQLLEEVKTSRVIVRDLSCFDCDYEADVLTDTLKLYCADCALAHNFCPVCGYSLKNGRCTHCKEDLYDYG